MKTLSGHYMNFYTNSKYDSEHGLNNWGLGYDFELDVYVLFAEHYDYFDEGKPVMEDVDDLLKEITVKFTEKNKGIEKKEFLSKLAREIQARIENDYDVLQVFVIEL